MLPLSYPHFYYEDISTILFLQCQILVKHWLQNVISLKLIKGKKLVLMMNFEHASM